ncbi:MAG: fibronectin type III domain-containing protein [Nitrospinales bacterium]
MQIKIQIKYVLALLLIFLPTTALAASVTLRWQANQEADISSYNVYYGTQSRTYGLPIPVGNVTSYTVENLNEGFTYYFSVTAVDTSGNESGYSEEFGEVAANATSSDPISGAYRLLVSSSSNRSNAIDLNGQTVSGNIYVFLDPDANVSQVVFSIDGKVKRTENYAPYDLSSGSPSSASPFDTRQLNNGSHTISALIRLQDGTTETLRAVFTVSNANTGGGGSGSDSSPPQAVALSTNTASTITEGQSVVLRGTVEGGGSNTEYRFSYRKKTKTVWGSSWSKWEVVRDWSSSSSFTWNTLDAAGNCEVKINARNPADQSGSIVADKMSMTIQNNRPDTVTLNTNRTSPQQQGSYVWVSGNATGGTGSYEYKFMYRKVTAFSKGKWNVFRGWSSSSGATWATNGLKGNFQLWVGARNAGSQEGASTSKKLAFKITK